MVRRSRMTTGSVNRRLVCFGREIFSLTFLRSRDIKNDSLLIRSCEIEKG